MTENTRSETCRALGPWGRPCELPMGHDGMCCATDAGSRTAMPSERERCIHWDPHTKTVRCILMPEHDGECVFPVTARAEQAKTGDLKAGRRGQKPPLHWIPMWTLQGVARVFDYGARKYAPGNWIKAAAEPDVVNALADYISAAQRHWGSIQEADDGGVAAWTSLDEESGLPHLDHLICSLLMLRGIAQRAEVMEGDPGRGKEPKK